MTAKMKDRNKVLLVVSLCLSFSILILYAFMSIQHKGASIQLFETGILLSLFFMLIAVYEISKSDSITRVEKTAWVGGLLFFGCVAGLVYLMAGRKRIVGYN
jgi:4-hydroxybenzoate polyprenyltransferase